jgi:hypothetical protein
VVVGEQAVAVWLVEVLSPAERQMAGAQAGREVLQKLGERWQTPWSRKRSRSKSIWTWPGEIS